MLTSTNTAGTDNQPSIARVSARHHHTPPWGKSPHSQVLSLTPGTRCRSSNSSKSHEAALGPCQKSSGDRLPKYVRHTPVVFVGEHPNILLRAANS